MTCQLFLLIHIEMSPYTFTSTIDLVHCKYLTDVLCLPSHHLTADAKAFGVDGYGAKASEKLMTVRGKDFRHEKTKKKRGSYRGGSITMDSNSFKYD